MQSPGTKRKSLEMRISVERMPSSKSIIKDSKGQRIEKLCGVSEWQPRYICITSTSLLIFRSENETEILDQIPLVLYILLIGPSISFREGWLSFVWQHEISSSDRTCDGPGEALIWLINTEPTGSNNGRQVLESLIYCFLFKIDSRLAMTHPIAQYAFTVESNELFEDWDSFLENQVSEAKEAVSKMKPFERSKVIFMFAF
jgi:hypothetical protein